MDEVKGGGQRRRKATQKRGQCRSITRAKCRMQQKSALEEQRESKGNMP